MLPLMAGARRSAGSWHFWDVFLDVHSFLGMKARCAVGLSVFLAAAAPPEEEEPLKPPGEAVGRAGVPGLFEVIGEVWPRRPGRLV